MDTTNSKQFPKAVPLFNGINLRSRKRFHLIVKPVGSKCNLACTYCYYLGKKELLNEEPQSLMDDETLKMCISQYCRDNDALEVVFSWQGGEPTLAGLDFYKKVVEYQQKLCRPGQNVSNTLQTNGTLIDEKWAQFLKENNFRVGLSIDGPEDIHNHYRKYKNGLGTFEKVKETSFLLKQYEIPHTYLAAINRYNVVKPLEVYDFLTQELKGDYIQLNPCVEHITMENTPPGSWPKSLMPRVGSARLEPGSPRSVVMDWSVPSLQWGQFLCQIYDVWLERDLGKVLVNWFETAVAQLCGMPSQICLTGELCGKGVAMNYDGKVYSCDHYVYPEFLLGDIHNQQLADMVFGEKQKAFAFAKQKKLPKDCLECKHGNLCWGQCPRQRFVCTSRSLPGLNYLCEGWKLFYDHAKPSLKNIAASLTNY